MSMVLWIKLETDSTDFAPDDLGYLFDQLEILDQQCGAFKVKRLSEFVDYSDMEFNISEEDLDEEWLQENKKLVDATELLITLRALENIVIESDENDDLLEEIRYVMSRCVEAEKQGVRVRLIAVM